MNKFTLLLLVALAAAVGYLLGTEQGREQRDRMVAMLKERTGAMGPEGQIDLTEATGADAESEPLPASQPA